MIVSLPYLQQDVPFDIISVNINLTPTSTALITIGLFGIILAWRWLP